MVQKKNVNLQGGSIFFLSWGRTGGPSPLSPYIARLRPAYSFLRHQPHSSAASGFSTPGISLIILGPQQWVGGSKFKFSTPGIDVGRDIAAGVWLGWDELEQVTAGTGQHCDDAEACSPILSWSLLLSWLDCCCLLFDLVFLGEKIWPLLGSSLLDTPSRLTSFNVWTAICAERQMSEKYQTLCRETRTRYSSVPNTLFLHQWLKLNIR